MIVEFDKSFAKSLSKIKDALVLKRMETVIVRLENAEKIDDVSNIKKLKGYSSYLELKLVITA